MDGALTVGGALATLIQFLSTVIFTWVPALVTAVTQIGTGNAATGDPLGKITQPVSIPDVINYLQHIPTVGTYYDDLFTAWSLFAGFAILIALILAGLLVYITVRLEQVRAFEHKRFEAFAHTVAARDVCKYNQQLQVELRRKVRLEFPARFERFLDERFGI